MNLADRNLVANIEKILSEGCYDENPRGNYESDGTKAFSKFITHSFETYDIFNGEMPIPTLMPTALRGGVGEIMWIYKDQTANLDVLEKKYGVTWWDPWDIGDRTIGQRYGATIRETNQMNRLLEGLEKDLFGRRHIVDMYQFADLQKTTGLNPCAYSFTLSARKGEQKEYYLDMLLNQRSSDFITAGYINKIQYTVLLLMIVGHLRSRGMNIYPGKFSHMVANLHIYSRHIEEAKRILTLEPIDTKIEIAFNYDTNFYDYQIKNLRVEGLKSHPRGIKLDLAI